MSAERLLLRGKQAAERLMVDTCTVRRRTGETVDASGAVHPTYRTPDVYTGRCRVQVVSVRPSEAADVGEDYQLRLRLTVQLPMSVVGVQVGDEVTVTASVLDADLVGRVFLVRDLAHKTHATMRRIGVTERTS